MRRRRGAFTILATGFLSLLAAGFAGSAAAGGPTSVLLVVPGEGRTASLYNSDSDYQVLADLVGAFDPPTGSTTPPNGADDEGASGTNDSSGPGVTLTWLMHDVNVWRVDRVYLKAQGGPLISSQSTLDGGDLWTKPALWHHASPDGTALTALLDRLGVGNTGGGFGVKTGNLAAPSAAPIPSTATPSDRSGAISDADGRIWGSVGVLLGIALTFAVRRWRSGGTLDDPTDAGPDRPITAPERPSAAPRPAISTLDRPRADPGPAMTETLSSHSPKRP